MASGYGNGRQPRALSAFPLSLLAVNALLPPPTLTAASCSSKQLPAARAGLTAFGALSNALQPAAASPIPAAGPPAPAASPDAQPTPAPAPAGQLAGQKAVVTGAARGIGRAIAVAFAREGADVMGLDIAAPASLTAKYPAPTRADLDETARLVRAQGRKFVAVVADTRDLAALKAAAAQAVQELGQVDILVDNAGIQLFAPLLEMSDAQRHDVIDTNLSGAANTVRAFAPLMAARKQGRIILTASGQGKKGFRDGSSYAASKWGIIGFMKSAALDLGQYNITVNALVPGLIATPMTLNPTRLTEAYALHSRGRRRQHAALGHGGALRAARAGGNHLEGVRGPAPRPQHQRQRPAQCGPVGVRRHRARPDAV